MTSSYTQRKAKARAKGGHGLQGAMRNGKEASSALEEDRLDGISTWTIRQKDPLEGNSLKSLEKLHAARRFCLLLSHAETK